MADICTTCLSVSAVQGLINCPTSSYVTEKIEQGVLSLFMCADMLRKGRGDVEKRIQVCKAETHLNCQEGVSHSCGDELRKTVRSKVVLNVEELAASESIQHCCTLVKSNISTISILSWACPQIGVYPGLAMAKSKFEPKAPVLIGLAM